MSNGKQYYRVECHWRERRTSGRTGQQAVQVQAAGPEEARRLAIAQMLAKHPGCDVEASSIRVA